MAPMSFIRVCVSFTLSPRSISVHKLAASATCCFSFVSCLPFSQTSQFWAVSHVKAGLSPSNSHDATSQLSQHSEEPRISNSLVNQEFDEPILHPEKSPLMPGPRASVAASIFYNTDPEQEFQWNGSPASQQTITNYSDFYNPEPSDKLSSTPSLCAIIQMCAGCIPVLLFDPAQLLQLSWTCFQCEETSL